MAVDGVVIRRRRRQKDGPRAGKGLIKWVLAHLRALIGLRLQLYNFRAGVYILRLPPSPIFGPFSLKLG
jgi:hypothetical protein